MAKAFFFVSSLLLCFALFTTVAATAAKDNVWVSPSSRVSCTMCASCDNPCHPLYPPPSVVQPPPVMTSDNQPPPSGSYYYVPPPPVGYFYQPPTFQYPGPPPPNPIMPYFPFYFYSPPPPSRTNSVSSAPVDPFVPAVQLFLLLFIPFLLFF